MDLASTPKIVGRRARFAKSRVSSPYKSPMLQHTPKSTSPDISLADVPTLQKCNRELWHKNEAIRRQIEALENKGYKVEELQWYIEKLHEYNEIKDVAQMVMGRLAVLDEVTVRRVHEQYGMTDKD